MKPNVNMSFSDFQRDFTELQKQEHREFIEDLKRQIEIGNKLIELANGNEEVIRMANELIKSYEKCISIEQNMYNDLYFQERVK